jgi:DNA invertase Pin-like site-specific DNA recombinase
VGAHVASTACELIGEYTEIETAKRDDLDNRPTLQRAIAHAKRAKATLVIAKLDRLARSVYVTALLMQTGVMFVACDNPHVNRMTIQLLAVVAEDEARRISERTTAALAAAKARGTKLGTNNLTAAGTLKGSAAGVAAIQRAKAEAYAYVAPPIADRRTRLEPARYRCTLERAG